MSLGQDIQNFLSSPFGTTIQTIMSFAAGVFIVLGCAHAVFKHHSQGIAAVIRRCGAVLVLGVFLAAPTLWVPVVTWLANLITSASKSLPGG